MKDFKNGFLMGIFFMVFIAAIISCTVAPLEASGSNCGETEWNPCYVKIVE